MSGDKSTLFSTNLARESVDVSSQLKFEMFLNFLLRYFSNRRTWLAVTLRMDAMLHALIALTWTGGEWNTGRP